MSYTVPTPRSLGGSLGVRRRPRRDRDDVEARLVVRHEMDVLHDEARTDTADSVVRLRRQVRPGAQIDRPHGDPYPRTPSSAMIAAVPS